MCVLSANFVYAFIDLMNLFGLWFSVPVNSYGHVRTLPPFYETSIQHKDVMTPEMYLKKITTQIKTKTAYMNMCVFT